MEPLKVYGLNITALVSTTMELNALLQTLVLLATFVYTVMQIVIKVKNNGRD